MEYRRMAGILRLSTWLPATTLSSDRLIEIAEEHPHHRVEKSKASDQAA
jgi:hypothetical protein